jgi:hypothetical protein
MENTYKTVPGLARIYPAVMPPEEQALVPAELILDGALEPVGSDLTYLRRGLQDQEASCCSC